MGEAKTATLVVSAAEAARLLKTDNNVIHKKLESGELKAYREGTNWKIPLDLLKSTVEGWAIEESKERKRIYESKK